MICFRYLGRVSVSASEHHGVRQRTRPNILFGEQKNFCYLCGRKDSTQMIVTDIRYYYYCRYGRFYGHNDAGYRV